MHSLEDLVKTKLVALVLNQMIDGESKVRNAGKDDAVDDRSDLITSKFSRVIA